MIDKRNIAAILNQYDKTRITIGVLGGHSALDVCLGAKKFGFNTVAVCQKGRELTYSKYYKSKNGRGIIDNIILVDKFADIVKGEVQKKLRKLNTIFIHNRYFWVYCNFTEIENKFLVPIFGTRTMLKLEERDIAKNQYYLLHKSGINMPKIFKSPRDIDRLAIVKVSEAKRRYERAFFFCADYKSYQKISMELINKQVINKRDLDRAVIEEYVIGVQYNFNFFYSLLDQQLDLMGLDTRRQTNLDGLLRLPVPEQIEVLKYIKPKIIEAGHIACTIKESTLEKVFAIGEKFVLTSKKEHQPGIIGPFSLQGCVVPYNHKEELVIFDVSLRIPGSPGTAFTPYSSYLYHKSISYGDRIAIEIKKAIDSDSLEKICT